MTLREQTEHRRRQFEEFNRWEAANPQPIRSPELVLADLSLLLTYVSPDEIRRDPDPEKLGVQSMRRKLALAFERTDPRSTSPR